MVHYAYYAFGSAAGLAGLSLIAKALVRYRICNSGPVTWGMGAGAGVAAGVVWLGVRAPFPTQALWPLLAVVATAQVAIWSVNRALQEGDLSTVAPLLSIRIPMAAAMAVLLLGETHGASIYGAVGLACLGVALFGAGRVTGWRLALEHACGAGNQSVRPGSGGQGQSPVRDAAHQ